MIKIKTYTTTPGTNFIEGTELAFTTIYEVRREGLQYDRFPAASGRTYAYASALGRIYFNVVFNPGERVYVIYKETSTVVTPIPGICEPVVIPATTLPNGVIDIPYSVAITLGGTAPFTLYPGFVVPTDMSLSISGNNIYLTGTPIVEGIRTVEFTIQNCVSVDTDSFSGTFEVLPPPITFTATNQSTGRITRIIPGFFTIVTGSFPITNNQTMTGVHGAFTGGIDVFVNGLAFPSTLRLLKNGSVLESIAVFSDDAYTFADQTFLSTDIIEINLS